MKWHDHKDESGHLLYSVRGCGRYWVRFECSEWWAYFNPAGDGALTGRPIGKAAKPSIAQLICRDHVEANRSKQPEPQQ